MRPIHAAVLLSTWALVGCQESARPPPDTRVHLLLTDAPLGDPEVTRVLVTFTRVDVYSEDTGAWEQVIDYGPSGRTFDLLALRGGITEELGAFELPPGTYDQIRLELNANNQIEVNEGAGPELLPLTVPSGEQTGIKLVHDFTVDGKGATEVVVDFDAEKSVKQVGHGWQVQPVVHIVSTTTSVAATRVIGPAGGTVRLLDEAQVDIPPGALSEETEISIWTVELPAAKAAEQALSPSSLVALGPPGVTFAVPVRVTVWYDPAELQGRPISKQAFAFKQPGEGWTRQAGTFDAQLGTCSGLVTRFGSYPGAPPSQPIRRMDFSNLLTTSPVAGTAQSIDHLTAPDVGSPLRPTDPPRELVAGFWADSGQQNEISGVKAAWTSGDASRLQIADQDCPHLLASQCTTANGCYDTGGLGCIDDGRFRRVQPVRYPGAPITITLDADSSKNVTSANVDVYGLRIVFHDFFVQDDSDNGSPGDLKWHIDVDSARPVEMTTETQLGTGANYILDVTYPSTGAMALRAGETFWIHGFFEDIDGGANGGADQTWFDHEFGWGSAGTDLNTNTDQNNGSGSLDIHVSTSLELVP